MTIVVGYIPTPEGLAAVEHALSLATMSGERLVVVNSGNHGSDADRHFADAADLDALEERLTSIGIEHEIRQPLLAQSPAHEILKTATEVSADLVVIGLRRRSPLGKLFLGSSSQQVLLEAPCPVLAVKASAS
jgi:nucleotide-binding universal stress UspA family protein